MQAQNQVKPLGLADSYIDTKFVENAWGYPISNYTLTINPNISEAYIDELPRNIIPPLSSTILKDTCIKEATSLILLEVIQENQIENIISEPGWDLYGNIIGDLPPPKNSHELQYPKNTLLWRSPQISLGCFEINPYIMTRQAIAPTKKQKFEIKVNLWFAPANTDCFIHNQHNFIEIHSQILGQGRMQKFKAQDYDSLYEDILMSPGYTTQIPFCQIREDKEYTYPWHQYHADTDCIWLAIEYHPIDKN
ncbi:MAG: hypothetical protein HC772_01305 [Leptolyngbyaceae cyanobacterium CRU_2_3]|nr:hypothetical protein [Leptolyngbyaceae cyanobacterium CRU_2_3]